MQCDPGRVQRIRQPFGLAHDRIRPGVPADKGKHAIAGRPGAGHRVGAHIGLHVLIDPLGGTPQADFAQSGQIALAEEILQRARRGGGGDRSCRP